MAEPKYGRITFAFPIESVSRKLTLRKNTASSQMRVSTGTASVSISKQIARYMGAGVRTNVLNDVGNVKKNYFFVRMNARTSAVTADEIAQRTLFGSACKMVARWKQDLSAVADVLNSFKNHLPRKGVTSYGMSLRKFMFNVAIAVLDDGGNVSSPWPTN